MDHSSTAVETLDHGLDRHTSIATAVRHALEAHGRLITPVDSLGEDADLGAAGLSSHATVNVMLAIEDALDIELPDHLLTKATFATIGSIVAAVETVV
jgi:acyl carrier protein